MKRVMICAALLFVPLVLSPQADSRPIVSVLDFQASGISEAERELLIDYLTSAIVGTGRYRVIDRSQRLAILREIEFSQSDCADEKCQLEIGKLLSANQIIVGSLGKVADRFLMNIRLIEVQTGETLRSASDRYASMNDLIDHSQELISRLMGLAGAVSPSPTKGPAAEKPAQGDPVVRSTRNSLGMELIRVEGGTFQMGDTAGGGDPDEKPVHTVKVSSFYLGRHEVTQAQWDALMGGNPSAVKDGNLPVEQVSWLDAVEFCNRLSAKERLKPCYAVSRDRLTVRCDFSRDGYRLPTEAEWEYAAKGGSSSRGFTYCGGNEAGAVAWYGANAVNTTHPVGGKRANELGLCDMSGNVLEWCWDWYAPCEVMSLADPAGAPAGVRRVQRGGSWLSSEEALRPSNRDYDLPTAHAGNLGFRVARRAGS